MQFSGDWTPSGFSDLQRRLRHIKNVGALDGAAECAEGRGIRWVEVVRMEKIEGARTEHASFITDGVCCVANFYHAWNCYCVGVGHKRPSMPRNTNQQLRVLVLP